MKFATRENLNTWVDLLINEYEIVAPQDADGHSLYRRLDQSSQIFWEFIKPTTPIKEFFFNRTEQILTFIKHGSEVQLHEVLQEVQRIILGVRPCDAHGLQILDAMFLDTPPSDPNYRAHRANTILIGLACRETEETCFCTSMGGAPDNPDGLDILLTEVEGGYLVETVSIRGETLAASLQYKETTMQKPAPPEMEIVPYPQREAWKNLFDQPIWEQTAERCLSCRVCAYVCPTCRCFDIRDEPIAAKNGTQEFERIRVWDSCSSEAYRKIAGGHNPRKAKGERLRNRVLCKFDYYPAQYGMTACTGCGRCIAHCPVNIDLVETLAQLAEVPV